MSASLLQAVVFLIHLFGMPLFFFLSGFFGSRSLRGHGAAGFLQNRVRRVLIPLVVGWFLLYPFVIAAWVRGLQHGSAGNLPDRMRNLAAWKAAIGLFLTGRAFTDFFSFAHLWFLYYLLLLSGAAVLLHGLLVTRRAGEALARTANRRGGVLLFALPVAMAVWATPGWNGLRPDESLLWPDARGFIAYGSYYLLGWLFGTREEQMATMCRHWRVRLVIIALLTAVLYAAHERLSGAPQTPELLSGPRRVLFCLSYAFLSWRWIFALAGLFTARFGAGIGIANYLSESSYAVYLVHLPIVIALQVYAASWRAPALLKYALIVTATMVTSLAMYELLVRRTPLRHWIGVSHATSPPPLHNQ